MITKEDFIRATGREPSDYDLERCNCAKAGELGHFSCGWDTDLNLPQFMVGYKINPDIPPKSKAEIHEDALRYIYGQIDADVWADMVAKELEPPEPLPKWKKK